MSSKKFKKGMLASSIAMILAGGASPFAMAAEESATKAEQDIERIQVTGIRGSNRAAVNAKRFSDAIVDGLSAEDIGQLPDSDVGQALARVPGVTVSRSFGQGASVSIRGTDPLMTLTTLNGQNVASTGWYDQLNIDRSFNYSMLPSELIAGMDVYKSSQANLVEGGIGGTVIVKTRKPLDMEANTVFASIKGEYGSINDEVSPELSGLYSWKNDEETFGILLSAAYVDREYTRSGTESDLDWGGRSSIQPSGFVQSQERTALDATFQYRPSQNLEFGAHILSLELGADSIGANMYINTDTNWGAGDSNCQQFNSAGVCTLSVTPEDAPTDVFFQNWARKGEMTSDTFELNAKYEGNGYVVSAVAGSTKAEGGTQMSANFGYGWWGDKFGQVKWAGTVDASGKQIKIDGRDMSFTRDQLDTTVGTSQWTGVKGPNSDEETYVQVDFDYDLDLGALTKFETGIRFTQHEFEKSFYNAVYGDGENSFNTTDLYGTDTMKIGAAEYTVPMANLDAMIDGTLGLVDHFTYNRPGYGLIEEDNFSLYGMFTFGGEGFRGNFGVRYVSTDVTSTGHVIDNSPGDDIAPNTGWSEEKQSVKDSYHDVLPSVNIAFDLAEDLIMRFSASQAMTRPNYDQLFLAALSGYPDDRRGNEEITFGNPGLQPMKSSQADLSLEYYYGDGNLFSATYFIKDISNFIVGTTEYDQQIGVPNNDLETPADNWTVNRFENAGGGTIDGIEFQLNHAWDNGFGVNVNYTFTEGVAPAEVYTDNIGAFTEASEHTANLVGYWENDDYSARVAYNYRSEYMVREYGKYYGNRMHDDFGTLDLTFGWNFSENIAFRLEVVNLTEEDDVQYGAAAAGTAVKPALQEGYPTWSFNGETTYKLGASFKF
jgi:iron complex outermembrane receptor protein